MSHETVSGPVLDSEENSVQTETPGTEVVKATLTGLTPAQKRLLGSLNEETVGLISDEKDVEKVSELFGALSAIQEAAGTNATYVGAYAVRRFVGTEDRPGPLKKGELAAKMGVTPSRITQLGRSAEIAFDLHIDPMSDLWRITSSVQNSPEFSAVRKDGLTPEKVAEFWAEEKAIESLTGNDRKVARDQRRARLLPSKVTTDTPAVTAHPNGEGATLSENGHRVERIMSELDTFTVPDADDCASLLAMRDRIGALLLLASESDRKSGAATYAKLSK